MPALFSLGQQPALQAVQAQLQPGEHLYAFLVDVYVAVRPDRVRPVYDLLAHHLAAHANIRLNQGKTRIWNSSGHRPANTDTLGPDTWVGDRARPPEQQGLTVLGAPVGTEQYVQQFLKNTLRNHRPLFEQLPDIQDLQTTWPAPAATICYDCSHQHKQSRLQQAMTSQSANAFPSSSKLTSYQSKP